MLDLVGITLGQSECIFKSRDKRPRKKMDSLWGSFAALDNLLLLSRNWKMNGMDLSIKYKAKTVAIEAMQSSHHQSILLPWGEERKTVRVQEAINIWWLNFPQACSWKPQKRACQLCRRACGYAQLHHNHRHQRYTLDTLLFKTMSFMLLASQWRLWRFLRGR